MKKNASVMGGPGKDFTTDYTDFTDKDFPFLTQSRKGAARQAATKAELTTKNAKIAKKNHKLLSLCSLRSLRLNFCWNCMIPNYCTAKAQRVFSGLASLQLDGFALNSLWSRPCRTGKSVATSSPKCAALTNGRTILVAVGGT